LAFKLGKMVWLALKNIEGEFVLSATEGPGFILMQPQASHNEIIRHCSSNKSS